MRKGHGKSLKVIEAIQHYEKQGQGWDMIWTGPDRGEEVREGKGEFLPLTIICLSSADAENAGRRRKAFVSNSHLLLLHQYLGIRQLRVLLKRTVVLIGLPEETLKLS